VVFCVVVFLIAGVLFPLQSGEREEAEEPPIARYECRRADGPIAIDGRLGEKAWERAERVPIRWTNSRKETIDPPAAFARMSWDDEKLYIAIEVPDTDVQAEGRGHDGASIATPNDVVEVFLDVAGDPHHFFELHVNPLNARNDVFVIRPPEDSLLRRRTRWGMLFMRGFDLDDWHTAARVTGTVRDDSDRDEGWVVEMAIPYSSLLMPFEERSARQSHPRTGETWRLQLVVQNCNLPRRYYVWSPTNNPWHHKAWDRWGRVTFTQEPE
jgi:hypothetical protein